MAGAESLRREMRRAVLRYRRGEGRSNEWSHGWCGVSKRNGECGAQILEGGCDRVSDHMATVDTHALACAQREGRDNDVGPPTCRGVWGIVRLSGLVGVRQVLHISRVRPMAVALAWPRLAG